MFGTGASELRIFGREFRSFGSGVSEFRKRSFGVSEAEFRSFGSGVSNLEAVRLRVVVHVPLGPWPARWRESGNGVRGNGEGELGGDKDGEEGERERNEAENRERQKEERERQGRNARE
jgi:hypothetical protein